MVNKTMGDDLVERLRKLSQTLDILECEDVLQAADRIEELEAKMAKAVELALEECPFRAGTPKYDKWWHHRRTTLTELKGGSNGTKQ